jgi:hypothetical protein
MLTLASVSALSSSCCLLSPRSMQSRPLSDTNPELFLLESPGIQEYRVENWRLSRIGNGCVIDGAHDFDWQDISILVVFLYLEVLGSGYNKTQHDNLHRFKGPFGRLLHSECWQCFACGSGVLKCYLVWSRPCLFITTT